MRLEHKRMLVTYLNHAFENPATLAGLIEHWPDSSRREPDLLDWRTFVLGWEQGRYGAPTVTKAAKRSKHNRERKARRKARR